MVRTQIQLTEEQAERAKRAAASLGISMAEFIRQSLDVALSKAPEEQARRKRALGIVGIVKSGLSDLSENHDKYLEDAYLE